MRGNGKVYVVCAIDTEGPIDDKRKPEILNTWERVDSLIKGITAKEFRSAYVDSSKGSLVYSWFILHLTGFKTNPFNRPMEYNAVYDHYLDEFKETFEGNNDGIYWHYHQPAPSGVGNEWCRDWTHCTEYNNVLSHWILDRGFFPSCFRAGGRIEDDDLSNWLEQWIPFDYTNNSGNVNWDKKESDGKKLKEVCDWTRAPQDWSPYHPSKDDYQSPGGQKRYLFRCPDLDSPVHVITDEEIRKAFGQAADGRDAVLAFFEHDRRDNVSHKIDDVCRRINDISKEYSNVDWFYKNAKEAAQLVCGLEKGKKARFDIQENKNNQFLISASHDIFGVCPFVCAINGDCYEKVDVLSIGRNKWITGVMEGDRLKKLGVAANNSSGESSINILNFNNCNLIHKEGMS